MKAQKPLPNMQDLGRFLSKCLCFTTKFTTVAVRVNGQAAFTVSKVATAPSASSDAPSLPATLALPADVGRASTPV
jgi:guanyl-specific ribonuclease Sa